MTTMQTVRTLVLLWSSLLPLGLLYWASRRHATLPGAALRVVLGTSGSLITIFLLYAATLIVPAP